MTANVCRTTWPRLRRAAALILAVLLLVMAVSPAAVWASEIIVVDEDPYAMTSMGEAADAIDKYLDVAFEYYLAGEANTAYKHVSNAYFVVYEVTGFERQTMTYISGSRKNAVELQFSSCKGAVRKELTEENKPVVRTELLKLKSMVREDANKLDTKNGLAATETKYYDAQGNLLASDPYPELAGDTDAATKYASMAEAAEAVNSLLDTSKDAYDGYDREAALDNYYTAYYTAYEGSGLSNEIYNYLGLEERTSAEDAFGKLRDIVTAFADGGSMQSKASKRAYSNLKKLMTADAEAVDTAIAAEKEAAAEEAAAAAAAAAAASGTDTSSSGGNSAVIFAGAFGIIVREGLEAILVIAAIIAYLVKSGHSKSLKSVYLGSVLGIVASFITAGILTVVKSKIGDAYGSQAQEVMEGITALIAVCVLFYVSNWMISKAEAASWTKYIDSKVQDSVETGSAFTLAFTAFLSVFREGAEVVLFYQPMLTDDGNPAMVWAGFGAGCVVLVGVYLAIRYLSIKLPIKPFFTATSILMAVMCVSFLGSGFKELAEGGVFDVTNIPWMPAENNVTDVLGIYPCAETIIPQLIMIGILAVTFTIAHYRGKMDAEKAAAAQAS